MTLPLCWIASNLRVCRGAARCLLFLACYLWCETIGILVSFWLWLIHTLRRRGDQGRGAYLAANFALQRRWANALKVAVEKLFGLRFCITGLDALEGDGAIVLPRHASIADTVIPIVFYAMPRGFELRYVLKRELLMDPCLDIVGNRLPNCFVARDGDPADIDRITALAHDLGANAGILIYPEGTRFGANRRARILDNLATRGDTTALQRASRWTHLLPPRLGGTHALTLALPTRDLLFCAHTGFESASHFIDLINGSWINAHIRIHFWRVDAAAVPRDEAAFRTFMFAQWDRMQDTVVKLQTAR